jgi:formamidopyrimidine-DNA glycosylase
MPELPEILLRASEVRRHLAGQTIAAVCLSQPKCWNLPPEEAQARLAGQSIASADARGKWIRVRLDRDWLMVNLGMGGEILLHEAGEALPEKTQAVFDLADRRRVSVHFWWFGHLHLVGDESEHAPSAGLGVQPLGDAFTPEVLASLLAGRRTRVKNVLLDQTRIAGIGNMYAHDILYLGGLHPLRSCNEIDEAQVLRLHGAIVQVLGHALELGGSFGEQDLHGTPGRFGLDQLLVGYKEGQPCPGCGTPIEKIRTGSTTSFICPACQPL